MKSEKKCTIAARVIDLLVRSKKKMSSTLQFCKLYTWIPESHIYKRRIISSFRHKGLAVDHIINDHNVAYSGCKLYQCRVDPKSCSFSTYQKFRFRHHMNNKHSYRTETENLCKMCNKSFKYLYTLKSHIKQVHQETEKRFQCDECGYLSKYVNKLRYLQLCHLILISLPFPFRTMQRARRHFRTHKPLEKRLDYACDQCDRKFTEKSHLYTHIRIVHLKIKEFR